MSPEKKDPFEQLLKNHLSASPSRPAAESCPDENWMAAYLEGSQSEHFKKTFERHLLQCDRCQAEMALLLKTGVAEAQPKPSALAAEPSPRSNLLALLFDWTRTTAFRPVFALLLVSVVTGVVGYQVLRDDRILQQRSMETTESAARRSSLSAEADQPPAAAPVYDQKSQEQELGPKSKPSQVPRRVGQDRLEGARDSLTQARDLRNREKSNSTDGEMKDALAAEPSSPVPAESTRDANTRLERRDVDIAAQPVPAPLQKESTSVVSRQNSQVEAKADDAQAGPKGQVTRPSTPSGALGTLSARRTEQNKPVHAEEAAGEASAKKKQALAEGKGEAGAFAPSATRSVGPIEVGGKRFDLIDGLWRDASILPDDPLPTVVNTHSPDFESHRKQLVPFQEVISRPEDVLIKLHKRVYRIQKAAK